MSEVLQSDICIVGGGLVGCSAALHLKRAGLSVVLVERDKVAAHASGVNFGGVRCHGRNALELPIALRSLEIWHNMAEQVGEDCEFMATGHLKVARTEAEMASLEQWRSFGNQYGIEVELLSQKHLQTRFPWLANNIYGASYCPVDGHANPRLAAPAFARQARAEGVTILEGHAALEIQDRFDGFEIKLSSGLLIQTCKLINAAGAWGLKIAAQYGDDVPVHPVAPQMFVSEPLPYFIHPALGMVSGGLYLRQIPRGNVIFGGGRGTVSSSGLYSWPSEKIFAQTVGLAAEVIPVLGNASIIRSWTGVEGNCEDGLPIVGASRQRKHLYHAFGFSGHGFQMAPGIGAVLSELITTGSTVTDIAGLNPQRFATTQKAVAAAETEI